MIIQPRIWGFICTTAHPSGCELNVLEQTRAARGLGVRGDGPKSVLVIGASTGYGLAARITAAFGFGAATLGIFLEKPGRDTKPGSAGWYNSAAFHKFAKQAGLPCPCINGDAFADATRAHAVDAIKRDLGGQVDLVIYSLAAPLRRLPQGATAHTALKPIGAPFTAKTIDTDQDAVVEITVPPASQEEIRDTVAVMGGEAWRLWVRALHAAGVLSPCATTVAYSYIGPEITWPIYWHGTIGRAKQHLENTAEQLRAEFKLQSLNVHVAMLKSVVTQASAAIPAMPLYLSVVEQIMRAKGLHEGCLGQQQRLFRDYLYRSDGRPPSSDADGRLRLDEHELRADVQRACRELWPRITTESLFDLTAYAGYKRDFLRLFGFGRPEIDYQAEVDTRVER
ncbi:MAG: enoyl-ACP reductase FabV [Gammaproteobacteria bacterium]